MWTRKKSLWAHDVLWEQHLAREGGQNWAPGVWHHAPACRREPERHATSFLILVWRSVTQDCRCLRGRPACTSAPWLLWSGGRDGGASPPWAGTACPCFSLL